MYFFENMVYNESKITERRNNMETIRSRMKKRGITMKMVAVASGTNISTVSQILNEDLNDRVKTAADRLIGVVDQEIVGSLNSEAYLQ
tara:strand:- start:424 stop:687 length:264 start_codon:yes stop_codon:yes gene_type:complete